MLGLDDFTTSTETADNIENKDGIPCIDQRLDLSAALGFAHLEILHGNLRHLHLDVPLIVL